MAEIEGFLCPLCMQDCRSVQELESHYREKHDESAVSGTEKFKKDFISFFGQVGNSLKLESSPRPKRGEVGRKADVGSTTEEGLVIVGPVTNVSGIEPAEWDPQEMGNLFLPCYL